MNAFAVNVPVEDLRVQADPGQITEALRHCLENAAWYSPSGSEIAVSAAGSGGDGVLRVADRAPSGPISSFWAPSGARPD